MTDKKIGEYVRALARACARLLCCVCCAARLRTNQLRARARARRSCSNGSARARTAACFARTTRIQRAVASVWRSRSSMSSRCGRASTLSRCGAAARRRMVRTCNGFDTHRRADVSNCARRRRPRFLRRCITSTSSSTSSASRSTASSASSPSSSRVRARARFESRCWCRALTMTAYARARRRHRRRPRCAPGHCAQAKRCGST